MGMMTITYDGATVAETPEISRTAVFCYFLEMVNIIKFQMRTKMSKSNLISHLALRDIEIVNNDINSTFSCFSHFFHSIRYS